MMLSKGGTLSIRRSLYLIGVALVVAAAVAACGGTDAATTGLVESSAVRQATYAKRATAICQRHGREMLASIRTRFQQGGLADEAGVYEELNRTVLAPSVEEELRELGSLRIPIGKARSVEDMLEALEAGIVNARAAEIASLAEFGASFKKFDRAAKRTGLPGCSFGA